MKRSSPPTPDNSSKKNKDEKSDEEIISSLEKLRSDSIANFTSPKTLHSFGHTDPLTNPADYIEVTDRTAESLLKDILHIKNESEKSVYTYQIHSRSKSNHFYSSIVNRYVLKAKYSTRLSSDTTVKERMMKCVLNMIQEALTENFTLTRTEIVYCCRDKKMTPEQCDDVVNDIACMLKATRKSLHIVGSSKGSVAGSVTFIQNGSLVDCTKTDPPGHLISDRLYLVENIKSTALFVLVIEKEATFTRVNDDRFYDRFPCILVTGQGQPDVSTRLFLRRLQTELKIPVFGLMDMDPYGLQILLVYKYGSKAMSYDSYNLVTENIKWMGLRPVDIENCGIPKTWQLEMTKHDKATAANLLKEGPLANEDKWSEDLREMLKMEIKSPIQSLSSNGLRYITKQYLKTKLGSLDFL